MSVDLSMAVFIIYAQYAPNNLLPIVLLANHNGSVLPKCSVYSLFHVFCGMDCKVTKKFSCRNRTLKNQPNEQHWSGASCVWFCSCLCKVCSNVLEAHLLALWTFFLTNNSSSKSKAFLHFIAFSGFPTAAHQIFLFFDAKAWPQSQTDLFTCTMVLHCRHTFFKCVLFSNA